MNSEVKQAIKHTYEVYFHIYDNPEYATIAKFSKLGHDHRHVRAIIEDHKANLRKCS